MRLSPVEYNAATVVLKLSVSCLATMIGMIGRRRAPGTMVIRTVAARCDDMLSLNAF